MTRIGRADNCIKLLLVQCTLCDIRKKSNPEIRNRYLSIKKRRGHKKAIIAIVRMLLTAIYNILKKNEPYKAKLYAHFLYAGALIVLHCKTSLRAEILGGWKHEHIHANLGNDSDGFKGLDTRLP